MRLRSFARGVAFAVALAVPAGAATTACGDPQPVVMNPTVWGPTLPSGERVCGYVYDSSESQFYPTGWCQHVVLYPANPPLPTMVGYAIAEALWEFSVANTWVHGPYYYDHVLLPASRRNTTIVVNRNTYINDGATFGRTWKNQHDRYVKKYPPTFQDNKGKIFKGDRFSTQANKADDLAKEQTAKKYGGLNAGAVADPAKTKTAQAASNAGTSNSRDPVKVSDPAKTTTTTAAKKPNRTSRTTKSSRR